MQLPRLTSRLVILTLAMCVALASFSCVNQTGVGVGVGTTARWGAGSSTRPPVFVGGPSMQ